MKNIYVFDLDNTLYEDPVDSEYMEHEKRNEHPKKRKGQS